MPNERIKSIPIIEKLEKTPSGIKGFDEITYGGLPKGRVALLCGGPGSGKTLFGLEFLARGATQYDEPGVFVSFEESTGELIQNVASLGFDLKTLVSEKKIFLDHVHIERTEIEETGEYNLDGLFIRIDYAVKQIGAKRVVLDTIEALFASFKDISILRAELRRLFWFLKERQLTAIVTAEKGERSRITRHGFEEYISDSVFVLDNRIKEQISTRRLRVVKYRGSLHGTNEYPFLIDQDGFFIMPVTSVDLKHQAPIERISTGIPKLDVMLSGKGFFRGSTIFLLGAAGTGKTSVAAQFLDVTCRRGEKGLFFSFEESPKQIVRNMKSIGIDLGIWVEAGNLIFSATRPYYYGLEKHLVYTIKQVSRFKPDVVIIDPMTDLINIGGQTEVLLMLARLIDSLKMSQVTVLLTGLIGFQENNVSYLPISSLVDTWILLREIESNGERNRTLHILKSRGMAHSNQVREMILGDQGVDLVEVYVGPEGVLTGSSRVQAQVRDHVEAATSQAEIERSEAQFDWKRKSLEADIAEKRAALAAQEFDQKRSIEQLRERLARQNESGAGRSGLDPKRGGRQDDRIETDRKDANGEKKAG